MTKDSPPKTRAMSNDGKKRSSSKPPQKYGISIVDQLRQHVPPSHTKRQKNDENTQALSQRSVPFPTDMSDEALMDIEFNINNPPAQVFQTETKKLSDKDDALEATENIGNINKNLFCTRVHLRVKVPPQNIPEEKNVQVLQGFLSKLQSFDPKVRISTWYERCPSLSIQQPTDLVPRPSELEKYFPRIFFKEEGFTWYSDAR